MSRLTPRQAVVVLAHPTGAPAFEGHRGSVGAERLDALLLALLRDAIAAVVPVDGVSIMVVVPDPAQVARYDRLLPAGLDLLTVPDIGSGPIAVALSAAMDRDFERILLVDGAVVGLTSRIVATGLWALAAADAIVGERSGAPPYAVGLTAALAEAMVPARPDNLQFGSLAALAASAWAGARRVRRLDPLPTLAGFETFDALREHAGHRSALGGELIAWLRAETGKSVGTASHTEKPVLPIA